MICSNCDTTIFVADVMLRPDGISADVLWSHLDLLTDCDDPSPISLELTKLHGSFAGIEAGNVDEAVEDTYFRLMIESPFFDNLDSEDRELFLLTIAQSCIQWTLDRKDY